MSGETLIIDCPSCGAKTMAIVMGWHHIPRSSDIDLAVYCGNSSCQRICIVTIWTGHDVRFLSGDITNDVNIRGYCPEPEKPHFVTDTPEDIADAFEQAERSRQNKIPSGAAMLYRRTLELATKERVKTLHLKDADKLNLYKRIELLGEALALTPDLVSWAHKVRILGNDSVHEERIPSPTEVEDLANLTWMFLVYLYALPAKVARMRKEKGAKGSEKEEIPAIVGATTAELPH